MKPIFFLLLLTSATLVFGQAPSNNKNADANVHIEATEIDKPIKIVYAKDMKADGPAYFLNGELIDLSFLTTLNPEMIQSINVEKENLQNGDPKDNGKIYIKTKSSYDPKFISLNELKAKYTNLKDKPTIFMIDGKIISDDYDKFLIDENYVLQITIDDIKNKNENINLGLLMLLTKSPENIAKSNEIMIRGVEASNVY